MEWLKKLFRKKLTLDDIIESSIYEEGRWVEQSTNEWVDTITGAIITTSKNTGRLIINGNPASSQVARAHWNVFVEIPRLEQELRELKKLEELYMKGRE